MRYILLFLITSTTIFGAHFESNLDNNIKIFIDNYTFLEYMSISAEEMHHIYISQSLSKDKNSITYTKKKISGKPVIIEKATHNLTTNSIQCKRTTYFDEKLCTEKIEGHSLYEKLAQEYQYHFNKQKTAYFSMLHALDQSQPPMVTLKTVTLKPPLFKENMRKIKLLVLKNDGFTTEVTPDNCYQYTVDSDTTISWNLNAYNPRELYALLEIAYRNQEMRKEIISVLKEINFNPNQL